MKKYIDIAKKIPDSPHKKLVPEPSFSVPIMVPKNNEEPKPTIHPEPIPEDKKTISLATALIILVFLIIIALAVYLKLAG